MGLLTLLRLRMALLAVLTVALVATGWGHRAAAPSSDQLAFMAATGASVADLCGEQGPGDRHGDPLCQACQISGGADLPAPLAVLAKLDLSAAPVLLQPATEVFVARVLDLSHAPQGPPTV